MTKSKIINESQVEKLTLDLHEIIAMLISSIKTAKNNKSLLSVFHFPFSTFPSPHFRSNTKGMLTISCDMDADFRLESSSGVSSKEISDFKMYELPEIDSPASV